MHSRMDYIIYKKFIELVSLWEKSSEKYKEILEASDEIKNRQHYNCEYFLQSMFYHRLQADAEEWFMMAELISENDDPGFTLSFREAIEKYLDEDGQPINASSFGADILHEATNLLKSGKNYYDEQ